MNRYYLEKKENQVKWIHWTNIYHSRSAKPIIISPEEKYSILYVIVWNLWKSFINLNMFFYSIVYSIIALKFRRKFTLLCCIVYTGESLVWMRWKCNKQKRSISVNSKLTLAVLYCVIWLSKLTLAWEPNFVFSSALT